MAIPGSSFTPTPLGHEDNLDVRHQPRPNALQWCPTRFNFPNPKVVCAAELSGLPVVYFYGSENVEEFIEGIDNQIKWLEIPSDLACAYLKEVLHRPSNSRNNYRGNYGTGHQRNQWFESRNGQNRDDQRFDRGYQSENRVQSENFRRGERRNKGSSTNFSRGNQRQGGRLNVLRVRDEQNDQSQSAKDEPI
ncbi:uncharacterized protein TNCV_4511031 [Trichonephila clavipes]|nr:uncharacterized protein TNCV_4511031 [Trichonephila clavipes]